MASKFKPHYLLVLLLILKESTAKILSYSRNQTVYDILPQYGLPSGLLPDSVRSYRLSEEGEFEVTLEKPCYIKFDYLVYYAENISGKLSIGSITDLKGIQVQRLCFFWFDVVEIRVDLPPSDSIYFSVGIFNREMDVHQFLTVRSCEGKPVGLRQQLVQLPAASSNDVPMLACNGANESDRARELNK